MALNITWMRVGADRIDPPHFIHGTEDLAVNPVTAAVSSQCPPGQRWRVRVHAEERVRLEIGSAPAPTATQGILVPEDATEVFALRSGDCVGAIRIAEVL